MHIIDSSQMLTLDIEEICCLGENKISDIERFIHFANGIKIDAELLFSSNFANTTFDNTQRSIIDYVIFDMLPSFYDIDHLKQYGDISFAVAGIGDYTLAVINDRIITMPGTTTCLVSGEQSVQFSIDAMTFQAFCRGLVLDASKTLLAIEDDEWEDRPLSVAELEQAGMPAGGFCHQNITDPQISNFNFQTNVAGCGANLVSCLSKIGTPSLCGANTNACLANGDAGVGCGANVNNCLTNFTTATGCAFNASVCSQDATSGNLCGTNAGACGAKLTIGAACGAKASGCGTDLNAGNACGALASACAIKFKPGSGCAAKAGACVIDVGDLCPANAVACVINVPGDIVGACIINIIPGLPSC